VKPAGPDDDPGRGRVRILLLVVALAIAGWNLVRALTADTMEEATARSLVVLGAIGLGAGVAGPPWVRMAAFLVGALLCLAGFALEPR
jgi:hypothetical protein